MTGSFEQYNRARTAAAADRDSQVAAQALASPLMWTDRAERVLLARRDMPGASWPEVARAVGVPKHAAIGRFRRAVLRWRAAAKAGQW